MNEFLTWFWVVIFSGLGTASLFGYKLPREPGCEIRCRMDALADLQDQVGAVPTAVAMFACAVFSFFWYQSR